MNKELPKVAAICATFHRPLLLEDAIISFEDQTYAGPKEMIIVDDTPDERVREIAPTTRPWLGKHVTVETVQPLTYGAKWNAAIALTDADILVIWDDDDWSQPERIKRQIAPLLEDPSQEVSVLWQHVFWDERKPGRYLRRRGGEHQYPDGAIMFRREKWLRGGFRSADRGGVRQWVGTDYTSIPADELLICRRHTMLEPKGRRCPVCQTPNASILHRDPGEEVFYLCTNCAAKWQRGNTSRPSDRWIHDPSLDGWRAPWRS